MSLVPVSSSAITAIGWAAGVLVVLFRNGRAYPHPGVPYALYVAFLNSSSKGQFYNAFIRGKFR